ncbi:hypothetical protein HMPREF1624_01248 [Sporothrix schenckii ATCC 58251]|uniref:Alpha/beta hydrolase fold-3 domain-containing protein n=1 Tax=Sporothrix schenckii (strain ATCC 58251 / de Perez 2211183) TaxID=1391915 RepID=U7Q4Z8_SPOS1|nr:hypothetical protein HMPREF1624_01248 [Sporothrix schenckii ATCC 58251]
MKFKDAPEYVPTDPNSKGGPRNGPYAELDPHFAAARAGAEAIMDTLWKADDWETFRNNWKGESPLPEGTPKPGVDVEASYIKVPARDGHEIELKIMKSAKSAKSAATADDTIVVLRMHGGGWAIGWHDTEVIENLHAASHPNVVLASIDYRLAPEYPFPTPLNDCIDAFQWVKANAREALHANPEKIVLLGGSAGSGLSLALALHARDHNISGIIALALDWPTGAHPKFFPELRERFGYELESYVQVPNGVVSGALIMEFFLDAYTPNVQHDVRHSPLLADTFAGLPPAFLQIAGFDTLRDEGVAVAEKLQRGGVPTEVHIYQGLPHCFSMLFTDLPQAKEYQARQNAFLEKTIKLANAK